MTCMKYIALAALVLIPQVSLAYWYSSGSYGTVNYMNQMVVQQEVQRQHREVQEAREAAKGPGGRGDLSARDFVEFVLSSQGIAYDDLIAAVPAGRIGVLDNRTGSSHHIDPEEFDPVLYTRL